MRNKHSRASNHYESRPSSEPEVDYSPKAYTVREQLVFGGKLFLIAGIILLLFWLFEKYM
jgi:hypothetical protein